MDLLGHCSNIFTKAVKTYLLIVVACMAIGCGRCNRSGNSQPQLQWRVQKTALNGEQKEIVISLSTQAGQKEMDAYQLKASINQEIGGQGSQLIYTPVTNEPVSSTAVEVTLSALLERSADSGDEETVALILKPGPGVEALSVAIQVDDPIQNQSIGEPVIVTWKEAISPINLKLTNLRPALGYQPGNFQIQATQFSLDPKQVKVAWNSDTPAVFRLGKAIASPITLADLLAQQQSNIENSLLGPFPFQLHAGNGQKSATITIQLIHENQEIGKGELTWQAQGPDPRLEKPVYSANNRKITYQIVNGGQAITDKDQLNLSYKTTGGAKLAKQTMGTLSIPAIKANQTHTAELGLDLNGQASTTVTFILQLGNHPVGGEQIVTCVEDTQVEIMDVSTQVLLKKNKKFDLMIRNTGDDPTTPGELQLYIKRTIGSKAMIKGAKGVSADTFLLDLPILAGQQVQSIPIQIKPNKDTAVEFTLQLLYRGKHVGHAKLIQWNPAPRLRVESQLESMQGPKKAVMKLILYNETGRELMSDELQKLVLVGTLPRNTTLRRADAALGKSLKELGIQSLGDKPGIVELYLHRTDQGTKELVNLAIYQNQALVSNKVNLVWEQAPYITLAVDRDRLNNGENNCKLMLTSDIVISKDLLKFIRLDCIQQKTPPGKILYQNQDIEGKNLADLLSIESLQPGVPVSLDLHLQDFNFASVNYSTKIDFNLKGGVASNQLSIIKKGH